VIGLLVFFGLCELLGSLMAFAIWLGAAHFGVRGDLATLLAGTTGGVAACIGLGALTLTGGPSGKP
jgi:hypothetical protein